MAAIRAQFGGDDYIRRTFPCVARETWAQFFGRMQSLSFSPQPGDPGFDRFSRLARELFDARAEGGLLRIDYATEVLMKKMVPTEA